MPCGTGSKLFYLLLQETKEIFIPDPSRKISIVHDSDPGSGCRTMRIRIQTMLFDCFYSDLLQKILYFCKISCKWYCPIGLAVQIDTGFIRSGSGQGSGIIADPDPKRLSVALGIVLPLNDSPRMEVPSILASRISPPPSVMRKAPAACPVTSRYTVRPTAL